jgi:hypothetical protein
MQASKMDQNIVVTVTGGDKGNGIQYMTVYGQGPDWSQYVSYGMNDNPVCQRGDVTRKGRITVPQWAPQGDVKLWLMIMDCDGRARNYYMEDLNNMGFPSTFKIIH